MKAIAIKGILRTDFGKSSTKSLRREEKVPCVLYGGDSNIHFSAPAKDFRDLIYTNELRKASIEVDGNTYEALIKEAQFHPVTDDLLHLDFIQLVEGKPVKTKMPIRLEGNPLGLQMGGVLVQKLRKLDVKAIPSKLASFLDVDISKLDMGDSIRVRDVEVGEGVEIFNEGGIPLASVEAPRSLLSLVSKTEEEEGEEGEEEEGAEEGAEEETAAE